MPFGASASAGLALIILCLTVYVPGLFSIPVIDRDEARFAQASRQMAESVMLPASERDPVLHSGGLVVPMVGGTPRLNKPPLVYYAQVASVWAFTGGRPEHDAIWMYRVPGVICATLSVLLTWRLGLRMFDPRAAVLGAALLAICPLMVVDAHMARADQLLLVTVLASQTVLWDAVSRVRAGGRIGLTQAAALWGGIGIGILAKGPITPLVVGLTAAAFAWSHTQGERASTPSGWSLLGRLRPLTGLLVVAVIVGPWVYAVGERVGWEKYLSEVLSETVGRAGEAREGHIGPPGYHTVLSAALLWPGSLLTLAGVVRAWRRGGLWRRRMTRGHGVRPAERFLLAWIVPSWIVFELILTKLPHYTMPMYPALALISARAVLGAERLPGLRTLGGRLGLRIWTVIGMAISLGAVIVVARDASGMGWTRVLLFVPCAMGASLMFAASRLERVRNGHARLLGAGMRVMVVLAVVLLQVAIPSARTLWNSERIATEVLSIDTKGRGPDARPIASAGYHEDSLVFLTRGRLHRIDVEHASEWLDRHPQGLVILPTERLNEVAGVRAVSNGWTGRPGYNYSNGRAVDLTIVERTRESAR